MNKFLFIPVVCALLLTPLLASADESSAKSACETATAEMAKAKTAKNRWTTSVKLMKKAKKALEAGEFDQAEKACNTAGKEAQLSVKQAEIEQSAWQARVPK